MKKIYAIAAAAASVLAISSCSKEITSVSAPEKTGNDGPLVEKTFYACTDDTKANVDGLSILWAAGDCIGVSAGSDVQKFSISGGSNTGTATFTGSVAEAEKYYAIYPYNQPGKSSDSAIMATEGIFTSRINHWYSSLKPNSLMYTPAYAVSTDGNSFCFKNFCAILKFTVPEALAAKLKKLEIGTAVTTEKITSGASGTVSVNLNENGAVSLTNGSTLCTIQQTFSAGTYYIAVAPITLTNGFYMRITFNDGSDYFAYRGKGGSIALQANKIYDLGTVSDSEELVFTEFNNGATGCEGTIYLGYEKVPCSTVTEGAEGNCMKYWCKGSGASDCQVSMDMSVSKAASLPVFPTKIRKAYNKTRMRVFLGELNWYPTVNYMNSTYLRLPSSINGVSLSPYCKKNCTTLTADEASAFMALWETAVKTDDWNEIEWNMADWSESVNWNSNAYLNVRFSNTATGGKCTVAKDDAFYIDNIRFVVSDSARRTLLGI